MLDLSLYVSTKKKTCLSTARGRNHVERVYFCEKPARSKWNMTRFFSLMNPQLGIGDFCELKPIGKGFGDACLTLITIFSA